MNRVMLDMENQNTLVSLAYIKADDNPLAVFCNYILYLLSVAPRQSLRADELKSKLHEQFGLKMPPQMINCCVRILKNSNEIESLPNGGGYKLGSIGFDGALFENTIRRLHEQETVVLTSIINFVSSNYKIEWTVEQAQGHLSHFLDDEGNGARLFISREILPSSRRISPSWYIGRYVTQILKEENSLEKSYLEDIVNGMMIYEGIYQTNDYLQDKDQKFRGTVFYFDTKLILRALGYSWDAQKESALELIDLITKKYAGKIQVFHQTFCEIQNALSRAGKSFDEKTEIFDTELRVYAELNPTGASLLSEVAKTLELKLKQELSITVSEDIDWNSHESRHNTIEVEQIANYIKEKHSGWRSGTIKNDVEIINQINILRKSDYATRYGGRKKLPVFVTTNTDLVFSFRDYVSEVATQDSTSRWNVHSLPIVSDNMILFRLWVPYANKYTKLPALTLARYAYAAQNPNTQYFEKLRGTAVVYSKEKGINLIDLSEMRRQKLEDILAVKTQGDAEQLTEEMVAMSVDELVKMENISLHTQITSLKGTVGTQEEELAKRDARIVALAARPIANRVGFSKIIIWVASMWWLLTTALLYALSSYAVGFITSSTALPFIISATPIVAELILAALDKWFDKKDLHHFVVKHAVRYAWKKYVVKIKNQISEDEVNYTEQIIKYCLQNTPIFEKYKEYCLLPD